MARTAREKKQVVLESEDTEILTYLAILLYLVFSNLWILFPGALLIPCLIFLELLASKILSVSAILFPRAKSGLTFLGPCT